MRQVDRDMDMLLNRKRHDELTNQASLLTMLADGTSFGPVFFDEHAEEHNPEHR